MKKGLIFLIASFCAKKNNQGFVETFQGLF